jgi:AcrR family transcriptional regulator
MAIGQGEVRVSERQSDPERSGGPRRSRDELVETIIVAATEVFAAGENPTVRAIATRAGVQPSVIYRYFPSKRVLLGEVVARGSRRDAELIAKMLGGPPERLIAAALGNTPYRAALLRGVLAGLEPADVPGGLPSVELTARGLMQGKHTPARPDEQYDPRLVSAFLAAALVGWQATGAFFTTVVGLDDVDPEAVQRAMAGLLDQVYGLAEPDRRMDDG